MKSKIEYPKFTIVNLIKAVLNLALAYLNFK